MPALCLQNSIIIMSAGMLNANAFAASSDW
jgi:hypothetical protein